MSKVQQAVQSIFRWPILWGGLASIAYYSALGSEGLSSPFLRRYTAGHPIEHVEVSLFFVGMAVLAIKAFDALLEFYSLDDQLLGATGQPRRPAEICVELLGRLGENLDRSSSWLVRRLRMAVEHVQRTNCAEGLDEHLHWLAEQDAERQYASYSFLRVVIWAIPILGFLGTVVGITMAIANLSPEALEKSLPEVTAGLGVAFDTTALALALSIVLMFGQFLTDRAENSLLARIQQSAANQLMGRFAAAPAHEEGHLADVRRMAETVIRSAETLVERQAELWQKSLAAAEQRWGGSLEAAGTQLTTALSAALGENLRVHAQRLTTSEQSMAEQNHRHWDQFQKAFHDGAERLARVQAELARQGEVLARAVEATGEVTRLEDVLNRNLAALAGAGDFDRTLVSLAAAIQLLTARLGHLPPAVPAVQLTGGKRTGQAA